MKQEQLTFFKEELEKHRAQIIKNIDSTDKELEDLGEQELNDEADYASASTDNMIDHAITDQQIKELKEIDAALAKIRDGSYGMCEMCEEEISIQRLEVKPHAKYCIACREIVEKNL